MIYKVYKDSQSFCRFRKKDSEKFRNIPKYSDRFRKIPKDSESDDP